MRYIDYASTLLTRWSDIIRFGGSRGRIEHDTVRESAEAAGVFGVPSFIVEGELFWGREHLAEIREKLAPFARNNPVRVAPSC